MDVSEIWLSFDLTLHEVKAKTTLKALHKLHLFCHRLTFANRWVIHAHAHRQCQH